MQCKSSQVSDRVEGRIILEWVLKFITIIESITIYQA